MRVKCNSCHKEKPESAFCAGINYRTEYCQECLRKHREWRRKRYNSDKQYIYGLFDPRDSRCRYIGRTCMPKIRPALHIADARNDNLNKRKDWINSLVSQGLKPIFVILEETTEELMVAKENEWINLMLQKGADLVNIRIDKQRYSASKHTRRIPRDVQAELERLRELG